MRRLLRAVEIFAWFALLALGLLALALRYWVLPDIERYRPDIVAAISRAVGQPVKVGSIDAGWSGLRPRIRLVDVRLYDAQGREALVLPSVDNVVSWRSLLSWDLRLHSLEVDAPRLTVRRDAEGVLHVAGIRLARKGGGEGRFTDWVLAQEEIVIHKAEIEWRDERRGAPPLALASLELRLRNSGDEHSLGLTARTPEALGSTLELRASAFGKSVTERAQWDGRLYAEIGYTDLAAWRPWIDYPVDLRQGQGALRLWVTLGQGRVSEVTADLALAQVVAQIGDAPVPLELASMRGRLKGRAQPGGYELAGRALELVPARGTPLPAADFDLAWREGGGSASARLLELAALPRLANAFPIPEALRTLIAQAAPAGRIEDATLSWQGELPRPASFIAKARFTALSMRPVDGIPGFEALTGAIEATESRGRLTLQSRNAVLELPGVFAEPRVAFDTLAAQADWERHGSALAVRLASASFANAHVAGSAQGSFSRAGENTERIDLTASASRADGRQLGRYLPLVLNETVRDWLIASVRDGQASDVRLRLRGALREFPFRERGSGEFTVAARVSGGVLRYHPAWPDIEEVEADLLFDRDRMRIAGRSGRVFGARLADVRVEIPRMASHGAQVRISGLAEGPTAEFLKFVQRSPVKRHLGELADTLLANGQGKLQLSLDLPLDDLEHPKVAGQYEFVADEVSLHAELPALERAAGTLAFTDSGFELRDAHAGALGGTVEIAGGTQPEGATVIVARGRATVEGVRPLFDHPLMRHVSGGAPYVATFTVREGRTGVGIESSLVGVASALPPPFDKAASAQLPLRIELSPSRSTTRERISATLGSIAAWQVQRRREGGEMVLQRASLWLSPSAKEPIRLPERPGMLVYGALEKLDADAWWPLLQAEAGDESARSALDLRVGTLEILGKRVHEVAVRAGNAEGGWSASVSAEELAGDIAYLSEKGGRLVARLERLTLPEDIPGGRGQVARDPADVPAIDLVAERFRFRGKNLGRVEVVAQKSAQDWIVRRLLMQTSEAKLTATGIWRSGTPSRSALKFELEATDAGAFLERVGYPGLVKGGRATLLGDLAWQGNPLGVHIPTLSGEMELHSQDGQFLEIEPGVGKLVALMSLQALPRRVTFDFSDVFSAGFQFDRISAEAKVKSGVMDVREFRMAGSAAEVHMTGVVDMVHETQDLKVRVVPGLGGTTSTAVAAVVNPVAGAAALLAQNMLKNPLGRIFAHDYVVSGAWAEPKVVKVLPPPSAFPTP
ncbi:MAG TPA: YhdP family protein [Burkholderiales bacterium]|nr:YhdP family protein [Burkholderiales bacterium]